MATVQITETREEWIVAGEGSIKVCVNVSNGAVTSAKIVGLVSEPVYIKEDRPLRMARLRDALTAMLEQMPVAIERTTLDTG